MNQDSIKNLSTTVVRSLLRESKFLRNKYIENRFKKEISLLEEECHNARSVDKSTLFFTTHKSGSVFASKVIKIMLAQENLDFVDLYGYFDMSEFQSLKYLAQMNESDINRLSKAFKPFGYVYTPLRHPEISKVIHNIEEYKSIFMLRNPKDVIISSYYSFGFTHEQPINKDKLHLFQEEQKSIKSASLDEYIIERSSFWKNLFRNYMKLIDSDQNFLVLKFEDMITDFNLWLSKIESFFEIKLDRKSKERITYLYNRYYRQRRDSSNIEISQRVQKYLDDEFYDILKYFEY